MNKENQTMQQVGENERNLAMFNAYPWKEDLCHQP